MLTSSGLTLLQLPHELQHERTGRTKKGTASEEEKGTELLNDQFSTLNLLRRAEVFFLMS